MNLTMFVHIFTGFLIAFAIILIFNRFIKKRQEDVKNFNDVLLNSEELTKHAQDLAQNHMILKDIKLSYMLIPKMKKNYSYIKSVYRSLNIGNRDTITLSQDAEWLLDNFYIIEEQVKEIRKSLSKGYYSGLPGLKNSILKGYPRIYGIALELISHTDGKIDEDNIINFISAYQSKVLLSSGELWALSLMLRIALIENIKCNCEKILSTQKQWKLSDEVANIIMSKNDIAFNEVRKIIHEKIKAVNRIPTSFFERLLQKIRNEGKEFSKLVQYIDKILAEYNTSITEITQLDHNILAARQVSIGNSITSLKYVSTLDWREIFEKLSAVEQILRQDPDGTYPSMDFKSRDYYRHEIEKIAKKYKTTETYVARKAIECAKEVLNDNNSPGYINHVGFYIIGKGKGILENKIDHQKNGFVKLCRYIKRKPTVFYISAIFIITFIIEAVFLLYTGKYTNNPWLKLLTFLSVLIPAGEVSVQGLNWILAHLFKPKIIPKIELKNGIPEEAATMVVIPTLLTDVKKVKELLSQLEVYYNANKEKNLYFALAGDFKDADTESLKEDEEIAQNAINGIRELNKRYADEDKDIFYYFNRKRQYNKMQGCYIGWERKRGALLEFNELLNGKKDTSYYISSIDIDKIPHVKYVITLDADTNLTINTAKKLIGTMLHPLNKAVIDKERNIVVEGYGLLQPRISVNIESVNATLFSKIFAGQGGIDLYTTAVSDVYQDVFEEGIFTGKGIYDVEVFRNILRDVIPENTVLSHDLLEGAFVRAGLVTDIELIDGYPARYNSYIMRLHRWVRGDWQLMPWLLNRISNRRGEKIKNHLTAISKWKIIDNMRRSLVSPAVVVLTLLSLSILPGHSIIWLGLVLSTIFFPLITTVIDTAITGIKMDFRERSYISVIDDIGVSLYQGILQFIFLPYQAYMMVDAVTRTIVRVWITKKKLLEWVTAADMEKLLKNDLQSFIGRMWIAAMIALFSVLLSLYFKPRALIYAVIIAILWAISPYIAYIISRPIKEVKYKISEEDMEELRKIAYKTWKYFEDFVDEKKNFLPPDNYQEDPYAGLADRTSPTNIGLYLASVLTARDLGFIGTEEMLKKIENTINTVERMEKWNGHLYNWYNTRTLKPMRPLYVSTVDSGNFVGYLITLKAGIEEYTRKPIIENLNIGLKTMLNILCKEIKVTLNNIDERYMSIIEWSKILDDVSEALKRIKPCDIKISKAKKTVEIFKQELSVYFPLLKYKDFVMEYNEEDLSLQGLKNYYERIIIKNSGCEEGDLKSDITDSLNRIDNMLKLAYSLMDRLDDLINATKFMPLYDNKRHLFSIGYDVEDEKLTKSYYDLLASEARQASFIAIARREIDIEHWFRLGRMLAVENRNKGLVSWSGTMFEYFMPFLIMKNYKNTLMDKTYSFVVTEQMKYAKKFNIPWGISESGFYAFDICLNYQYKAFGVPWLGLKRGLSHDLVVAPYGTMLALSIDPESAINNFKRLKEIGMYGNYGFYEAVDFTPERIPYGKKYAIVKSFMSHHQGMSLLALNNFINKNIMQKRFHKSPVIKAAEILLQERVPSGSVITREEIEAIKKFVEVPKEYVNAVRVFGYPKHYMPEVHALSNGRYSVLLTDRGTGYSKKDNIAVTRWRNEPDQINGIFIYIQNINSNMVWSATYAPCFEKEEKYKVVFTPDKAEYTKKVGNIDTNTEIIVSPEDDAEIRRVTLKNHSDYSRTLDITSYLEVVLNDNYADIVHQAFNKLFIKTEFIMEKDTLIAYKRPRDISKNFLLAVHTVAVEGCEVIGDTQYETDRAKFIGRGRTLMNPQEMEPDKPLSNTVGSVLDPIMALRKRVRLLPGQTARIIFTTAITDNKTEALKLADKYSDASVVERAFEMAFSRSRVELDYLNLKGYELELFQKMLPHIVFNSPQKREREDIILKNKKGQSDLWTYGISGDVPIILAEVNKSEELNIVKQLLKAHEYWRMKGLTIDLVILNRDKSEYLQLLNEKIKDIIYGSFSYDIVGKYGGIFLIQEDKIPQEDMILLYSVAKLVFKGDINLELQMKFNDGVIREKEANWDEKPVEVTNGFKTEKHVPLEYDNGIGGFSPDSREYIISLNGKNMTPAPWINVISNSKFGFQVSESGGGYTWSENSREFKLTPWSNDPVIDEPGEILYLRDEENGVFWTATPIMRDSQNYTIRHGHGYTIFKHAYNGIEQQLVEFVPLNDAVKISILKLKNLTGRERFLTAIYYVKPVLGVTDVLTSPYIVTSFEKENNALLFKNQYNNDFPDRIAFISSSEPIYTYTGDRLDFLGIDGDIKQPGALKRKNLSNKVGAGYEPCAAFQIIIDMEANEEKDIVFLLGCGKTEEDIIKLIRNYKDRGYAKDKFIEITTFWDDLLGTIKVTTPDKSADILLNGWLLYQTIACRIWARSAFYQSGGAYGFRDQLQDAINVQYVAPELAKMQILNACQHQYAEGDVMHWWHPDTGIGIRTRYSDDLLWLPYATADYIKSTGDLNILEIEIPFLEGKPLREDEDERCLKTKISEEKATVYEHCIRAIEHSLKFGEHGIPLMGSGDWNDGMNMVGNKGKGESVWLGWFLYVILKEFTEVCRKNGDLDKVEKYEKVAADIVNSIEGNAWDGSWYTRAYFDNGMPLGSQQNTECKIDSLSQSWSAISGAAKEHRVKEALKAVENYLISYENGLIKLLFPPFDDGELNPGYIKGYVPGVRENGGQYTHAAVWVILAYVMIGEGDKAWRLYNMINPINHTRTPIESARYKVEPYVMAADVYAVEPNVGRGGWTWYTGAAGWMYRVGLEHMMGFKKHGDILMVDPCIPKSWGQYTIEYNYVNETKYIIEVKNPEGIEKGVKEVYLDGELQLSKKIKMIDDNKTHKIKIILGK
nr:glucoamylase family protein [Aceticella autotrophica]